MEDKNKIKEISEIYEIIFDNAPDGILLADVENKNFYIGNKMICQMLGYSLEEIKNMGIMDIHAEEDLPYVIEQFEKQSKKEIGIAKDLPVKRKDGSIFYADVNSVLIALSGKPYIAGIFRDTTERKKAELALLESEDRFRTLADNIPQLCWMADADGSTFWYNQRWYEYTGTTPEQMEGWGWQSVHDPGTLPQVLEQWKSSIATGKTFDMVFPLRGSDGVFRHFLTRVMPVFDQNGKVVRWFGTNTDVTERKNAEEELRKLTEELKRSNADLQQFAYAASHDLQEPLRGIASFAGLLEKHYKGKLDKKADEFINHVVDDAKRMQMLIKDLLEYSQIDTKGKIFGITNCSVVLEEAIYNLRSAIEESGTQVTYDLLPTIMADGSQLKRLFQNLIGNAIKFRSDETPKIHISSRQEGNEWVFSVQDNGIGIDPQYSKRIFVIFQRLHTRQEYQGTGIGLSICNKIVARHGGRMWLESEPGKGSTFYFTIPDRRETS